MTISARPHVLPEDSASLRALAAQLQAELQRDQVELLRTQLELERYKKLYYGPRADRLWSDQDLAQMLLCPSTTMSPRGRGSAWF